MKRWANLWDSESKLLDQDGTELGRVQRNGYSWYSYIGLRLIATGQQTRETAKRLVEASL